MFAPGVEALLQKPGPFVGEFYESGQGGFDYLNTIKVLVIGAGGLGCELLKCLSLSGFKHIDVIDMDRIEISNLNRQFLFREADVGKYKSEVAAKYIKQSNPDIEINAKTCRIQELKDDYYQQFHVVIGGLDNIEARLWISETLVRIARNSNNQICIPYVDGGTEAWSGNVRISFPNQTSCLHCHPGLFTAAVRYQSCTLVSNPRKPEHCIQWAKEVAWDSERSDKCDSDNDDHVEWIMNKAKEHAKNKNLDFAIDFKLTRRVIKNTVSAIASTQAIIASMCVTEILKIVTQCGPSFDNYLMYSGSSDYQGISFSINQFIKNPECSVCSIKKELHEVKFIEGELLGDFLKRLGTEYQFQDADSLYKGDQRIYSDLLKSAKKTLKKPVSEFAQVNDELLAVSGSTRFYLLLVE